MPGLSLSLGGAGGPILIILFVLSLACITVIVAKASVLWRVRAKRGERTKALQALASGSSKTARAFFASGWTPADRIVEEGFRRFESGEPKALIERALTLEGQAEVADLYRHIRILELIAMISPLLGLLGTVLGMIQAFQELELAEGAANAGLLAGGIWQALLTTAAGLSVAIPAATGAALLSERADAAASDIEHAIGAVLLYADSQHADS